MKKKILIGFVGIAIIYFALDNYIRKSMGFDVETIFKIGGCVKDDEMGVTYRINGPAKGSLGAEIILSEKYPSLDKYRVGSSMRLPLNENPQRLYAVQCP